MVLREKLFKRYTLWHGSQLTFQFCFQVGKNGTKKVSYQKVIEWRHLDPLVFRTTQLQYVVSASRCCQPSATWDVAVHMPPWRWVSAIWVQPLVRWVNCEKPCIAPFCNMPSPKVGVFGAWVFFGESEVADMVKGLCSWDGTWWCTTKMSVHGCLWKLAVSQARNDNMQHPAAAVMAIIIVVIVEKKNWSHWNDKNNKKPSPLTHTHTHIHLCSCINKSRTRWTPRNHKIGFQPFKVQLQPSPSFSQKNGQV